MTILQYASPSAQAPSPAAHRAWLRDLWAAASACSDRSRQRRTLAQLDDRLLRDVGLSREMAQREASKHFWRR